jgi:hypothetical protein
MSESGWWIFGWHQRMNRTGILPSLACKSTLNGVIIASTKAIPPTKSVDVSQSVSGNSVIQSWVPLAPSCAHSYSLPRNIRPRGLLDRLSLWPDRILASDLKLLDISYDSIPKRRYVPFVTWLPAYRLKVLSKNRKEGKMHVKFGSRTLHLILPSMYLPNEHYLSFSRLMSYFKMPGLQLRSLNWRKIMRGQ